MPLGPSVVLTMSAMAMAPTNDDMRAFSPCSTTRLASRYHSSIQREGRPSRTFSTWDSGSSTAYTDMTNRSNSKE
jgi:hypothetical protein